MDNEQLIVPQNSRIEHGTRTDSVEAQNSPVPPKCSPVSCPSRLSSVSISTKSKENGSSPVVEFKRHFTSPEKSPVEDKEVVDLLKSRLYDRAENSDVYRRQPRVIPHPPLGTFPKVRPTMYRTTLLRKDKARLPVDGARGPMLIKRNDDIKAERVETSPGRKQPESSQPLGTLVKTSESSRKTAQGFGPDQFKGEDILSVVKTLRARLKWETDPDVIINDPDEVNKEQKNYMEAMQDIRKVVSYPLEDDGEFAYAMLENLDHRTARYHPYNLVCVGAAQTHNLKQLFTVTASAVTQLKSNNDRELTPMPRWLYERKMFNKIFEIQVFAKFRQWKAFTTWKNNVRCTVNSGSRQTLCDTLFIVDDVLQLSLLEVRRLCEEACSSSVKEPANVFFVDENFTETLTLQGFGDLCIHRADVVKSQLAELRSKCLEIALHACQNVIERHEGLIQWIKSERGFTATKPSFTQIAQWRTVLRRLSKFVRSIDFVVLGLLRRLVVTAANTLFIKVHASSIEQYPWRHNDGEKSASYDESSENEASSPPAILKVQLVLGIPEPGASDEVNSTPDKDIFEMLQGGRGSCTSSNSSADETSSEQSQFIILKAFVNLNPSEEEFVTVIRRVIAKFEEVVSCFKSLLTDDDVKAYISPPLTDLVYSLTRNEEEEEGIAALEDWPNAELIFGEDPDYQDTINKLITLVRKEINCVQKFSTNYKQFCSMVDVCRMVDVNSSMEKCTWTHDEFNAALTRHVEQVDAMEEMVIAQRVGFFLVEVNSFRDSSFPYPTDVLRGVHYHLPIVAAQSNNTLITIIKCFAKNLEKYPDSVEEFMERLSMQTRVSKELPQLEQQFVKVTKLYSLATSFDVFIEPEEMALYKTLMPSFHHLKSTLLYCEAKKDENIFKFSRDLEILIGKVREDLVALKNKVRAGYLIESTNNPEPMLRKLSLLGEQLEEVSSNAKNYAVYQDHFTGALSRASRRKAMYTSMSLDEATKVDHAGSLQSDVAEVEQDLSLRKLLWESFQQWSHLVKTWQELPFENLNVDEMQKTVGKLIQTIYLLEKGLPANNVVSGLKGEVTSFKQGMPAVTSLRNPALRSRHWEAIQTLMQQRFIRDNDFTLGTLLQMNVFHYKVKIAEISSNASNEYTLEQMLRKVMDIWKRTDFNLAVHCNRDIAIINGADEIITALEDSLVTLANIKSSRYVLPIKTLVEEWDRKLALFSLALDEWLTCQRHWLYLQNIFTASDIQRQLPNETRLFGQVDKSWKDIMRRTADRPNAILSATSPGVLEILQTCNTQLEKIHRCLEVKDYLETKRLVFARFYFLSNDELLDILSNSKNPHSIEPHLKKCFSNIRKLRILQEPAGAFNVHDMVSAENECVELQKPVKIRGAVESWLATVEQAILGVIKLYLKQALVRSNQEFTKWVVGHPGQVVLTASQILFCRSVIACMQSEDVDKCLRALHQQHLATLSVLVELVMSSLLFYQRQSVEALLTIKVHERDTLQTLIQEQIHDQEDFQWKRQLRYRWNEVNNTCNVLQHNASFDYGYEYLGCSPRLVITPLTDRCYLTLTGALHLHLGGAPFGPAGTGKTETVKDLAKAMGKQCVVFNCSEGLDFKMTGKFFSGIAQSGSWFCFDEFNRIDLEVLSVIAQQLHTIKTAKDLEATWFVFEGRDIRLSRYCGVFITMNPGYAGRVELPDNVKSLYRPVAMMVPDYVLITEIILFSEGFLTAVSLSRKVVNLYELITKQLSQQDHYDFGLRSIKSMLLLAGQHKRTAQRSPNQSVEEQEAGVLLKAIRSTNTPKFVTEDIPLFEQILLDLFPGLATPSSDEEIFQKAIDLALEELSLQQCASQIDKVRYFHENLLSRCGIALVGPTGGGKTTMRKILKEALSFVPILRILDEKYREGKGKPDAQITKCVTKMTKKQITTSKYVIGKKAPVHVATINPKCVNLSELYGEFNPSTMEWKDGLLSIVFRKFSKESNAVVSASSNRADREGKDSTKLTLVENEDSPPTTSTNTVKRTSSFEYPSAWFWLVLDGPVDSAWVENLNTVLDDTRVLCLASGERISVGLGMKFIFEVDNLAKASPATVSRCAIVYVDPNELGWKPYVKAWLEELKEDDKVPDEAYEPLMSLFEYSVDKGLEFRRTHNTSQLTRSPDLGIVTNLCGILNALFHYLRKDNSLTPTPSTTTTSTPHPSSSSDTSDSPVRRMSSQFDNLLSKLFLFAFTWSVGGEFVTPGDESDVIDGPSSSDCDLQGSPDADANEEAHHNVFDSFVRGLFRAHPTLSQILPPTTHAVFDYFFNLETEQFMLWQSLVPKPDVLIQKTLTQSIAISDSFAMLDDPPLLVDDLNVARSLVPTRDTIRYGFLLSLLLLNGHPVLLTGEVGVGKTILVEDVLLRLSKDLGASTGAGTILGAVLRSGGANMSESLYEITGASRDRSPSVRYSSMQCSARLGPSQVQALITNKLIKTARDTLGTRPGSKVLVFMDDLNMPEPDEFGAQPPLELVREYLDHGGFYNTRRLQWIDVGDVTVVAACGPSTGGRHVINPRVLRHFNLLFLPCPSMKALHRIFHVRLGRHLQGHDFIQEVREMCHDLVFATLSVFFAVSSKLLPTPAKSHYTFNLKDVNKVIEGLLQAHYLVANSRANTALLFGHEATRVFYDRLVDKDDRAFFHEVLVDRLDDCLRFRIPIETLNKKPLIFGDFSELNTPKAERIYRQIKDVNLLSRTLQEYYSRISLSSEKFDQPFVFFRQAVEHLSRAARVFRQPSGHLLLLGVGGTGKSSVVQLAAYLELCEFRTLRSFSNYNIGDFHEDVKCAFYDAGLEGKKTVLFLNDRNLVKESFFEDISCMLNGGEVPDMFNNEDKERIFLNLRKTALEIGVSNDKLSIFELFKKRVNQNIHIAISTTPSGTVFRQRCRVYPSLINCCTIDWYDEWPSDALESVGNAFLQSTELSDSKEQTVYLIHKLTKLSVDVHRSSQEAAARFFTELKRRSYATPSTYIECIQVFLKIFAQKRKESMKYSERLSAGILKLDQSYELVGKMQQELVQLGPELEQKTMDTESLLKQLAKDQKSVDEVRHVVSEEESIMNDEAKRVQEFADEAQEDLDLALPALNAANEELNALDKSDIAEVRVYTKPPTMVMTVTAAVCTILQEKTDWANTKQVLADPGFLKRLISFEKNNLSDRVFAKLKRFTNHPNFHPDHVGRISVACRSMCQWVIALDSYAEIFRAVQPKRARCKEASAALEIAKKNLDKKQLALAKIEEQLQILQEQYQASVSELEYLHERKRLTTQRLKRASVLSIAFSEEHDRWLSSVGKLDERSHGLIGDSLLSSATIAYLGAFSQSFRTQIVSQWYQCCVQRDVPISGNYDFIEFLTKPIEIQEWLSNCLPHDNTSIQSAVVVKNSQKWPLLIDPQRQAIKWIAEIEKNNHLKIVKSTDPSCLSTIEEAVQLGRPVVITEIGESLDPRLESVLHRRTTIRGNQEVLKISGSEVEYNSNFRLYLATPLSNPHFFPEVFNQVTVINFTVNFEGLQDQLLSRVVYEERPGLENEYVRLIENLVIDRCKIRDFEDKCLDLLNTSHGNILDDEELVVTLKDSKNTASTIQRKVEQSESAQSEIRSTREHYLPVATRGAIIYFTLVDLPTLDVMYQFSLQWFVDLFISCLLSLQSHNIRQEENRARSPLLGTFQAGTVQPLHRITKRSKPSAYSVQATAGRAKRQASLTPGIDETGLQAHLEQLVDVITETVYRRVTHGLFARHQTVFSFLLCCNILQHELNGGKAKIEKTEWNLFIWGAASSTFTERLVPEKDDPNYGTSAKASGSMGSHVSRMAKPPVKWITVSMWQECMQLSSLLPALSGLCSHIAVHSQYWLDFSKADDPYLFLGALEYDKISQDSLKSPKDSTRMGWSCARLSSFQRLMLLKILRAERLLDAVRTFVKEHLGVLFVSAPPADLQEIFKESDPKIPLIFILSPGSDPASQLMRFARDIRGSTCHLDMISLGRGQEDRAEETITKAYRHRGRWVFLQNCHLASSFLPRLKEIVRKIADPSVAVESPFRLWLSSAPHQAFPISILQTGIKMTVESLPGIKANILQSFASVGGAVSASVFEDPNPGPHWRKLLFGLCLFNAVVHERKKFGALGWNIVYDFANADLEVSISMLRMLLTEHENVPWTALTYLTAEVTYGGRVTDMWDKRCIINIVEKFYSPETLNDGYCYSSSKLYRPPSIDMTFSDCCDYIESLPSVDHPELFGMQTEANQFCMQNEAKHFLDDLVLVHPHIDSVVGSGKSNDEIVLDLVSDVQKYLPRQIGTPDEDTVPPSKRSGRAKTGSFAAASSSTLNDGDVASSAMNTVLRQEVDRFTRLLNVIHASLNSLYQSIHGQVLLSKDIEETHKSLLHNQVPREWQKVAYSSSKPLTSWISNLVQRTSFFTRWLDSTPGLSREVFSARSSRSAHSTRSTAAVSEKPSRTFRSPDMPRAFWISAFFFPQGFFTSVLQRHARVYGVPVDSLKFKYEVTDQRWLPEDPPNERDLDVNRVAFQGSNKEDCVRIFGLYLDGAFWEASTACLAECRVDERFSSLPEVKVSPVPNDEPSSESNVYECPLYSTPLRGDSFVMAVHLPSRHPPHYWITRGVALVSQLPE